MYIFLKLKDKYFFLQKSIIFERYLGYYSAGVYILQNTMARGGGMVSGNNNDKWGIEENEGKTGKEKGKRKKGKGKRRKGKGGEWFFLLIYGTILLMGKWLLGKKYTKDLGKK